MPNGLLTIVKFRIYSYRVSQAFFSLSASAWQTYTDKKKKIKFSSYIRKFGMEQLQSHIWLTASSYMTKYLRISSNIRKPFLIYDFATAPFLIYVENFIFFFISV